MNKGLEELERLYVAGDLELDYVLGGKQKDDYDLIEKALKALEIIKEKVGIHWQNVLELWLKTKLITTEEYDLLKEILL